MRNAYQSQTSHFPKYMLVFVCLLTWKIILVWKCWCAMEIYAVAEHFLCKWWSFVSLTCSQQGLSHMKLFSVEWGVGINKVLKRNPTNCCFQIFLTVRFPLRVMQYSFEWCHFALYSVDGFKWEMFNLIMHSTWKRRRTLNWSAPLWWRTAKCTRTAWIRSWCSWKRWNVSGTRLSTNVPIDGFGLVHLLFL